VSGDDASDFLGEGGGHRWQRVPPNEKNGKVHTSTVTVAVLRPQDGAEARLDMRDVDVSVTRGDGPGGQHRNKTESAVVVVHRPTGERVRIESTRSQYHNRQLALSVLEARLTDAGKSEAAASVNGDRRGQIGRGERGDKVRTYRCKDDQALDHRTGRRWRLSDWMAGDW